MPLKVKTVNKEQSPLIFFLTSLFFILTILVAKQVTRPLDLAVTVLVQTPSFKELDYFMFLFSILGSIEFTCFTVLVVSWYYYQKYQWPGVFLYLFFFVALSGVEFIWKYIVTYTAPAPQFNRQPFELALIAIKTPYSFPSGHTFRSVFLMGMWFQRLNHKQLPKSNHILLQKIFIGVLILLIGISRIYLGDHWLSDVIGGILLAWIGLLFVSQSRHFELDSA